MHSYIFLFLLSSGVSSYFLSQKKMPHLFNKTKYALIDEMLCLLGAENKGIKEMFITPLRIKEPSCAHSNTEIFIRELKKLATLTCMRKVEKDMEKLEKSCDILKKSSSNKKSCQKVKERFPEFKERLQEFLRWVNEKVPCRAGRNESSLYLDGKCSCRGPWKSLQGLG